MDLGTAGYGGELFESWYRQTASHNTVMIDGISQPPAAGQAHRFVDHGPFQVADASVKWARGIYAGVVMRRVILARSDYFIDLFVVHCDRERRVEWLHHCVGKINGYLPVGDRSDLDGEGYECFVAPRRISLPPDGSLTWITDQAGLRLFPSKWPGPSFGPPRLLGCHLRKCVRFF
jgi:hypothetical protein